MSTSNDPQQLAKDVDGAAHGSGGTRSSKPRKPKNYLLRPGYRRVDLKMINSLSEEQALLMLQQLRWGEHEEGQQCCPKCGVVDSHYVCRSINGFKCRSCKLQFTVFSGTRLHSSKMRAKEVLSIALHFVESKDGMSSRELSGLHGRSHQTLHVMTLKIREALRETLEEAGKLHSRVQADAAYFLKYVRPENVGTGAALRAKQDQKNAGLDENAKLKSTVNPEMCALVVFVQEPFGASRRRCRIAMVKTESQVEILPIAQRFCSEDAVLVTDQHSAYAVFSGEFDEHHQVNHNECFMDKQGLHTNLAEGVFSRIRAAVHGAWHRMSIQHLVEYGWELCWRLEMVGLDNQSQLDDLLKRLLRSGRPTRFVDYWKKRADAPKTPAGEIGIVREVPKEDVPKKRGRPSKGEVRLKPPARQKFKKLAPENVSTTA